MSEFTPRSTNAAIVTTVASSASSVAIATANTNRRGISVQNTSTAILYLLVGGTAPATATTNHSVQIPSNGYWEAPYGFTGALTGIWASANGSANITEYQ